MNTYYSTTTTKLASSRWTPEMVLALDDLYVALKRVEESRLDDFDPFDLSEIKEVITDEVKALATMFKIFKRLTNAGSPAVKAALRSRGWESRCYSINGVPRGYLFAKIVDGERKD